MAELLDQPAVVVLAAAAAALLLLVEVALPTFGLAGTTGLALALLAAWGVREQDAEWWPLAGMVAAVALWGVLIVARRHRSPLVYVAAALFLAGGLGYAALAEDWAAAGTAVLTAAALFGAFPRIAAAADQLASEPPVVGMESLVGSTVRVVDWEGTAGRVQSTGTLWSATGPASLRPGDEAVVSATSGLSLRVDPVRSARG